MKKEELKNKGTKTLGEFKEFIAKGNVLDMAVGVIIGSAFGKIVTSIVNDILMPIIGVLISGINVKGLSINVKDVKITYGNFLQNVLDFLIIAVCIFFMVKAIDKITKRNKAEEKVEEPKKEENTVLLEEIRDLLKEKQNV